jgi:hypothetical protein
VVPLGETLPVVVRRHPAQQRGLLGSRCEQRGTGLAVRVGVLQQRQHPAGQVFGEGASGVTPAPRGVGLQKPGECLSDEVNLLGTDAASRAALGCVEHRQQPVSARCHRRDGQKCPVP